MSESEPQYENPDVAEELRERTQAKKREERERLAKHASLKERLEEKRAEKSVEIVVDDIPVEFRPLGGKESKKIMKIGQEFDQMETEGDLDEMMSTIDEGTSKIYALLGEYSKDDALTAEWWEKTYSLGEAIAFARQLMEGGDTTPAPEELEEFR